MQPGVWKHAQTQKRQWIAKGWLEANQTSGNPEPNATTTEKHFWKAFFEMGLG